jgi:hypothetical protein
MGGLNMADLYRKSSIEKLSNPEQLDKTIKVTTPLSWLALFGVFVIVVSTVIWSITGTLAQTATLNGIIVGSQNIGVICADEFATVEKVSKKSGDKIKKGDVIYEIKSAEGKSKKIIAAEDGVITAILVDVGSRVYVGAETVRYTPSANWSQVVVCYVPVTVAESLKEGMNASLYLASVDSQKYGHMEAVINKIGKYTVSTSNMGFVLGADNLVAEQFLANGPVVAVICEIKTDTESKSGYYWTNDNGKELTVSNGAYVSAKVVVSEDRPISKLLGSIKDILGE